MRVWRLFLLGEALSNLGTGLGYAALGLLLAQSGDAFLVAFLGAMGYIAQPISLFMGVLVDRFEARWLILAGKLFEAAFWLALAFLSWSSLSALATAFLVILVHDLASHALNADLTRLKRRALVGESARFQNARLLGYFLGALTGPALVIISASWPFLLAACMGMLATGLFRKWPRVPLRHTHKPFRFRSVLGGVYYVFTSPSLRPVLLVSLLIAFTFSLGRSLRPLVGLTLGTPEALLGVFLATATLGGLGGNSLATRLSVATGFWTGLALAVSGDLSLAVSRFPLALLFAILGETGYALASAYLRALRQWLLPSNLLGRGRAAIALLLSIGGLLGAITAGWIGKQNPLLAPAASGALLLISASWLWLLYNPRRMQRLADTVSRSPQNNFPE